MLVSLESDVQVVHRAANKGYALAFNVANACIVRARRGHVVTLLNTPRVIIADVPMMLLMLMGQGNV